MIFGGNPNRKKMNASRKKSSGSYKSRIRKINWAKVASSSTSKKKTRSRG